MRPDGHLHAMLGRYRKRRTRSIDGRIPGVDFARRGGQYATGPMPSGQVPQTSYDPHPGFMELDAREYRPDEYEHADAHTTPPLRAPQPDVGIEPERLPDYESMLQAHGLVEEVQQQWQAQYDNAVAQPEPCIDASPVGIDSADQAAGAQAYDAMPLAQAEFEAAMAALSPADTLGVQEVQADTGEEPGALEPKQIQSLEQILEQEMPDPWLDPFQQMQLLYDQQMMQLMHPFMMPGPMM